MNVVSPTSAKARRAHWHLGSRNSSLLSCNQTTAGAGVAWTFALPCGTGGLQNRHKRDYVLANFIPVSSRPSFISELRVCVFYSHSLKCGKLIDYLANRVKSWTLRSSWHPLSLYIISWIFFHFFLLNLPVFHLILFLATQLASSSDALSCL